MTRAEKAQVIMEHIDESAYMIPYSLEEYFKRAIIAALEEIDEKAVM